MRRLFSPLDSQRGSTLIIALILLLVMTVTAIYGLRTITLEEKMAAATLDRNVAFQDAEAALLYAEGIAEAQSKTKPPNKNFPSYSDTADTCPSSANNTCSNGLCAKPDKDCPLRWEDSNFTGWTNATIQGGGLSGNAPQYFIEYLGNTFPCSDGGSLDPKNCMRYRITVRSNPSSGRAMVMLQSIYGSD